MKVVGITSQQEVYIGSKEKNFRINEFLIIEDKFQGDLIGEIVEAQTFNRYIPLEMSQDFVDSSVLDSLRTLGYNIDEETIYIGKLRLLEEALYPVETGSDLREPSFKEVKSLMIPCEPEDGLVIGTIKNTDNMMATMDDKYKNLVKTFERSGLKDQREIPYILDIRSMHHYPHIGIFGGSGSGKSFGMRVILEELMVQKIPTIVLDPHYEMDFRDIPSYVEEGVNFENRYRCLQVGVDIGVRFQDLNPSDLKNLLDAASSLTDSMNNAVDILFKRKDSLHSFQSRLKMLTEAQELGSLDKIERRIEEATDPEERKGWQKRKEVYETYDKTCPYASVRGIMWRLNRLENDGVFSQDIRPVEEGIKRADLIVIQGNTRILQVFSTYLLNNLYHKRRAYKDAQYIKANEEYFPPFILVTDEAHNFAPKGYDSPSKSIIKEISQEGRKYGVFLILATQRPTLLDETITAQLNTKFIFRTVRSSDIQTIKEETDLTFEETKRLPYLRTGDVFISSSSLGRTVFSRIRAALSSSPHKENPFDELKKVGEMEDEKTLNILMERLPVTEEEILDLAMYIESNHNITYTKDGLLGLLEDLASRGLIEKEKTFLGNRYKVSK